MLSMRQLMVKNNSCLTIYNNERIQLYTNKRCLDLTHAIINTHSQLKSTVRRVGANSPCPGPFFLRSPSDGSSGVGPPTAGCERSAIRCDRQHARRG